MWIYVKDYGNRFIWECLKQYVTGSPITIGMFVLYIAAIIGLLIRGTSKERFLFVCPNVAWLFTVFNPWLATKLITFFSADIRYYRYLWMLPLPIVFGYLFIKLLDKCNKILQGILISLFVILCVAGRSYWLPHLEFPENIYKIDQNVIDVAEIIKADSEKEENIVLYNYNFFYELRLYDASNIPFITRTELTSIYAAPPSQEQLDEAIQNNAMHDLIKYEYVGGYDFPQDLMVNALASADLDYIVLPKDSEAAYLHFLSYGCVVVDETKDYYVLRCDAP